MKMRRTERRQEEAVRIELYPDGGAMYALYGAWRPVSTNFAVDDEARAFAEGVRQLVVKLMRRNLRTPL